MTLQNVTLRYACASLEKQLFSAEILLQEEGSEDRVLLPEVQGTFAFMMSRYAEALQQHDGAVAVMQRTDVAGSRPLVLESAVVDLLRTDPAAAIRAMSPAPRTVVVRDTVAPVDAVNVRLRVGHDTLADSFGDFVYLRLREGLVESPVTGRWVAPKELPLETEACGERWYRVVTRALLALGKDRYYLPRSWNTDGPWVSHVALAERYDNFCKEIRDAVRE